MAFPDVTNNSDADLVFRGLFAFGIIGFAGLGILALLLISANKKSSDVMACLKHIWHGRTGTEVEALPFVRTPDLPIAGCGVLEAAEASGNGPGGRGSF